MVFENYWLIITGALAVLSISSLLVALSSRRSVRLLEEQIQQLEQRTQREMLMLNSSAVGVGKRVVALNKQLKDIDEHAKQAPASEPSPRPVDQAPEVTSMSDAEKLLLAGVEPEIVAKRCDISQAEASLMKIMQAPNKQGSSRQHEVA